MQENNVDFHPTLLAVGGGMELLQSNPLVEEFIKRSDGKNGKITVLPTASDYGEEVGSLYKEMFAELCNDVEYYIIDTREDTQNAKLLDSLKNSTGIFFTGGNQLKITSLLGGSPVMDIVTQASKQGVFIAGTSAGASAMSDTMISWGPADSMLKGNLKMSPGIGLVKHMVIDSHFVKRGRISRLLHLVTQNPGELGVGLSEDTGILIDTREESKSFQVIGKRQVVIVDGTNISHVNIAGLKENKPFSVTDVNVHVLGQGYMYDYRDNRVLIPETIDLTEIDEQSKVSDMPYRPNYGDY